MGLIFVRSVYNNARYDKGMLRREHGWDKDFTYEVLDAMNDMDIFACLKYRGTVICL